MQRELAVYRHTLTLSKPELEKLASAYGLMHPEKMEREDLAYFVWLRNNRAEMLYALASVQRTAAARMANEDNGPLFELLRDIAGTVKSALRVL